MGPFNGFEKPDGKENPTNSEVLTSLVNHWLHDFPERIKELYGADAVVQTARSDLIGAGTRVDRVLSHVDITNALMGKQLAKHTAPPGLRRTARSTQERRPHSAFGGAEAVHQGRGA